MSETTVLLCPGQGAQLVGMGRAWAAHSPAASAIFAQADSVLGDSLGMPLSELCFDGPAERLNQTDASQPAIYTCTVASYAGLLAEGWNSTPTATAGLSLGEYSALHLAGVFSFEEGLELVANRGRLMQEASEASVGGMVALMGADEPEAESLCEGVLEACKDASVLVPANFNAPGQIVLSGDQAACGATVEMASERGFRAKVLPVAGAFHSSLMAPAAEAMGGFLAQVDFKPPVIEVWSNVTAEPHPGDDSEQIKQNLVQQITHPVRWAQSCAGLIKGGACNFNELAPGNVLKGLMRRVDRQLKVQTHDEPSPNPTD